MLDKSLQIDCTRSQTVADVTIFSVAGDLILRKPTIPQIAIMGTILFNGGFACVACFHQNIAEKIIIEY